MTEPKYFCEECENVCLQSEVLDAPNPFDESDRIAGCPHCKQVNSLVRGCDICGTRSSIGTPTERGYKCFCRKHYEEYKAQQEKEDE